VVIAAATLDEKYIKQIAVMTKESFSANNFQQNMCIIGVHDTIYILVYKDN